MKGKNIISVDLGGTKILTALINSGNEIVAKVKIPTDADKGSRHIVSSIARSVKQIIAENEISENEVKAVCVGVPGTVNPYTGVIGVAPNLGIKHFNIKESLMNHIAIPVLIENDVNLAGLGIKKIELKDKVNNMLVVFIGTGIGGALFFEGKLYRGSSFYAGEIGHMKVNADGGLLTSNGLSSFELTSARPAIEKAIKKDIKKGKKSILNEHGLSKKTFKSKKLAHAVKANDPVVTKHLTKACVTIGTVLGSLTTLLNLDTIILGGGVIEAMHGFMLPIIKSSFKESVLGGPGKNVKINYTKLGDDSALYGGIALTEEFLN